MRQYPAPPADSYTATRFALAVEEAESTSVEGAEVSAEFFRAAEVQPVLGRLFVDPDFGGAPTPVAVVSYRCWEERFASDAAVLGRVLRVDGRARTIVGVLPRGFDIPRGACLWLPRTTQ